MTDAVTRRLPIFALSTVLLPGATLPLHVFERRYRQMVEDVAESASPDFVVLLIKEGDEVLERPVEGVLSERRPPVTHEIGTVARIVQAQRLPDGRYFLLCQGIERVRLMERTQEAPYPAGTFVPIPEQDHTPSSNGASSCHATAERIQTAIKRVLRALQSSVPDDRADQRADLGRAIGAVPDEETSLSYFVARCLFTAEAADRQRLLEAPGPCKRLELALPLVLLEERLALQRRGTDSAPHSPN